MSTIFWKSLLAVPTALGAIAAISAAASAQTAPANAGSLKQVEAYSLEGTGFSSQAQVTSVSQLTDVRPTDWAFQALQSLVERYGCIVGYPDKTYRGNRALSRYEFAAGLNACMDRVNELIAAATADLVRKEDLLILQRLQEEFAAELATLRGRVDALEVRTATLEKQQFSTTTKLNGEVIFGINALTGDDVANSRFAAYGGAIRVFNPANSLSIATPPTLNLAAATGSVRDRDRAADVIREAYRVRGLPLDGAVLNNDLAVLNTLITDSGTTTFRYSPPRRDDLPEEVVFSNRVRLNFDTSFTGKDLLRTRLQAGNFISYSSSGNGNTGTNMTRLGYDDGGGNQVSINELWYRFPIGKQLKIQVDAANAEYQDSVIYTFNPLFQSSGTGALSRFGRFNPIYRLPGDNAAGAAFSYKFGDSKTPFVTFEGGYYGGGSGNTSFVNVPTEKNGLFDGGHAALAQLVFRPSTNWDLGLTYARSYFPEGDVNIARSTGSELARRPFGNNVATAGNHFGIQTVYRVSPQFSVSGWFGYTVSEAKDGLRARVSGIPSLAGTTDISIVGEGDNASTINWAVALGYKDLFKRGSLAGLIIGQQPRVIDNDSLFGDEDDSNWHIEGLYRYPISDNIDLTPGFMVIVNPENNSSNDTIYVGTLRATFKF